MKKVVYLVGGILISLNLSLFAGVSGENAELSNDDAKKLKKEKKAWKKKMKKMPAEEFLAMIDEYKILQGEEKGLNRQIEKLSGEMESLQNDIAAKTEELLKAQEACKAKSSAKSNGPGGLTGVLDESEIDYGKGTTYKVQIGSFQNPALQGLLAADQHFSGDVDHDGTRKYTIGYFRDYAKADRFKKILLELNVKDAWIVAYKNNQRLTIEDVLGPGPHEDIGMLDAPKDVAEEKTHATPGE